MRTPANARGLGYRRAFEMKRRKRLAASAERLAASRKAAEAREIGSIAKRARALASDGRSTYWIAVALGMTKGEVRELLR